MNTTTVSSITFVFVSASTVSYCVSDSTLFLLSDEGSLTAVSVCTLDEYVNSLLREETIHAAMRLCLKYSDYMKDYPVVLARIQEINNEEDSVYVVCVCQMTSVPVYLIIIYKFY